MMANDVQGTFLTDWNIKRNQLYVILSLKFLPMFPYVVIGVCLGFVVIYVTESPEVRKLVNNGMPNYMDPKSVMERAADFGVVKPGNSPCPFHPPDKGEKQKISDNSVWDFDEDFTRKHLNVEDAHHGIYEFIGPGKSLVDIGAGVGNMRVSLDRIGADVDYFGFDIASNIMELEGEITQINWGENGYQNLIIPHLCWVDASKPFHLDRTFDFVLSKDVGQQIPPELEQVFMDNLVRLAKPNGGVIILTWARPSECEAGFRYVNCREQSYIIEQMERLGVEFHPTMTSTLGSKIPPAYAKNLMVFYKP